MIFSCFMILSEYTNKLKSNTHALTYYKALIRPCVSAWEQLFGAVKTGEGLLVVKRTPHFFVMKKDERKVEKTNRSEILIKMAHALSRIVDDMASEDEEEQILNKVEVLGQIRDDLLSLYCDYKLIKK